MITPSDIEVHRKPSSEKGYYEYRVSLPSTINFLTPKEMVERVSDQAIRDDLRRQFLDGIYGEIKPLMFELLLIARQYPFADFTRLDEIREKLSEMIPPTSKVEDIPVPAASCP